MRQKHLPKWYVVPQVAFSKDLCLRWPVGQTFVGGLIAGLFNLTLVWALRYQLPRLFTTDPEVIELVAKVTPVVAIMQVFDALAVVAHGVLRGIGRQEIGGYINLAAYYLVALPISFGLAFGLKWKLAGLWTGVTVGLFL